MDAKAATGCITSASRSAVSAKSAQCSISRDDLLHRTRELTKPLWQRLLDEIRTRPIVGADETRLLMQNDGTGKPKNGFVWTFVAADEHGDQYVAYVFAGGRSGETPKRLLAGTKGTLIVDGYTGYNVVAEVSSRKRAACHAHLRRYFHEALPTAPIAQEAIDLLLGLYRVEHDAKSQEITGTKKHLRLRRQRAGPIRDQLHEWLLHQKPRHPPKSPISTAIRYALNQWRELGRFLGRRTRAARQQRLRALAATGRARSQELPLRRRRRGRQEHRKSSGCHVVTDSALA